LSYRDLVLAGIPKRDERGRTLDVHALRHTFSTLLSKGGVAPRTAQAAMRHSDISLTMNTYTDPKLLDVHAALNSLPSLSLTNDQADRQQVAPDCVAPNSAQSSEPVTIADKIGKIIERAVAEAEKLITNENSTLQTTYNTESKSGRRDSNPRHPAWEQTSTAKRH